MGRKNVKHQGGRPGTHGSRQLARLLNENILDQRTVTARMLKQIRQDLADDAGGEAALTGRERALIERTACILLITSSIEGWAFKQKELLGPDGSLPPVLATNYLSFVNTARLNLLALGLTPKKPDSELDLATYLKAQKQLAPAPTEADSDVGVDTDVEAKE